MKINRTYYNIYYISLLLISSFCTDSYALNDGRWFSVLNCGSIENATPPRPAFRTNLPIINISNQQFTLEHDYPSAYGGNIHEEFMGKVSNGNLVISGLGKRDSNDHPWTYQLSVQDMNTESLFAKGSMFNDKGKVIRDCEMNLTLIDSKPEFTNQAFQSSKRLALVIGNANYLKNKLANPKNDADDISKVLIESGFKVINLRDGTLAQMRNSIRDFGDQLPNYDVGLVYYSGHGIESKGKNYFIPINADIKRADEVADQGLDVNLILDKFDSAKKQINILIVDACRDDPFGRGFRSSSRGLAQMDAPQGTIISFATSPGRVADDGEGRNSPYTKNLVKQLQVPNLPIEQVFKKVRVAVQTETKNQQIPWENTSLSGEFYFRFKRQSEQLK